MSGNPELRQEPDCPQPNLLRPDVLKEVADGWTLEEEVSGDESVEGAGVLGLDAAEGQGEGDRDGNDEAEGEGVGESLNLNLASEL